MYTQFCFHYRKYANTTKATLRIKHKPGELMEVDWAVQTAFLMDILQAKKSAYILSLRSHVVNIPTWKPSYLKILKTGSRLIFMHLNFIKVCPE